MRVEFDRWKGERLDFDLKEYLIVQRALLSDRIGFARIFSDLYSIYRYDFML